MTDQTVSEAPSWTREWRRTFSDLVELFTLRQQLAEFEVFERFYEIGSPDGLAQTEDFLRSKASL